MGLVEGANKVGVNGTAGDVLMGRRINGRNNIGIPSACYFGIILDNNYSTTQQLTNLNYILQRYYLQQHKY
jgi:hypothetical protein